MENIFQLFKKLGEPSITDQEFVSFNLRLSKPHQLEYSINGFLDEKNDNDEKVFNNKLEILHGVESNFSYTMSGDIEYPDEFESKNCELMVNPLGGSDYLESRTMGLIGDGWYEKDKFIFRLYISPQMSKDIIDRRILAEQVEAEFSEYEDWVWEKLRIDVCEFGHNDKRIWFKIIRVYC